MQFPNGVSRHQVARSITSRRLELTILPTEKCNFRCTYCYEDFLIGRMKPGIVAGIKSLISRRAPDLGQLQLNWFGGEPLLAKSVIMDVAKHAKALSIEYGFEFSGGLTTNGYLLDSHTLSSLVAQKQDFFQVTLDGWGANHDVTRRRADGGPTFDRIWSNLIGARSAAFEFECVLRLHSTPGNQESLLDLCNQIRREFGADHRFRVDFQDIRNLGGAGGATVSPVGATEFKNRVIALKRALGQEAAERVTETTGSESSASRRAYEIEQGEPYICYAARPNHFLIRADGRLGKCTVALNDPLNDIGSIDAEGRLDVDQFRARAWSNGFEDYDLDALGCPLTRVHRWTREQSEKRIDLALSV